MECSPQSLLCPWNSPCKNTGVGCHFLLQDLPDLGSNLGLPHCRQILYHLSYHKSGCDAPSPGRQYLWPDIVTDLESDSSSQENRLLKGSGSNLEGRGSRTFPGGGALQGRYCPDPQPCVHTCCLTACPFCGRLERNVGSSGLERAFSFNCVYLFTHLYVL